MHYYNITHNILRRVVRHHICRHFNFLQKKLWHLYVDHTPSNDLHLHAKQLLIMMGKLKLTPFFTRLLYIRVTLVIYFIALVQTEGLVYAINLICDFQLPNRNKRTRTNHCKYTSLGEHTKAQLLTQEGLLQARGRTK